MLLKGSARVAAQATSSSNGRRGSQTFHALALGALERPRWLRADALQPLDGARLRCLWVRRTSTIHDVRTHFLGVAALKTCLLTLDLRAPLTHVLSP